MSVAIATPTSAAFVASAGSLNVTASAGEHLLITVHVAYVPTADFVSATYNGAAITPVVVGWAAGVTNQKVVAFYVPAYAGTASVSVAMNASGGFQIVATRVAGADSGSPIRSATPGASGSGSPPPIISAASAAGDLVLYASSTVWNGTRGTANTFELNAYDAAANNAACIVSAAGAAGSVSIGITDANNFGGAAVALSIVPSSIVFGEADIEIPIGELIGSLVPGRVDATPERALVVVAAVSMAVDSAGTLQTLYFSTGSGWTTGPTDTPPNTFIDGRVMSAGSYDRTMFAGKALFGAQQVSYGAIELANHDGALDALRGYGFDSRRCEVLIGRESDPFPASFVRAFVTEMTTPAVDVESVALVLRDPMRALDRPCLRNLFAGTGGVEGPSSLAGQPRPRALGTTTHTPMVMVDSVKRVYFVCDEPSTAGAVSVFDGGSTVGQGAEYTSVADVFAVSPAAGQARVFTGGPTLVRFATVPTFEPTITRIGTYGGGVGALLAAECGLTVHSTYNTSPSFGEYADALGSTYLGLMTSAYRQSPFFFGVDRDGKFVSRALVDPSSASSTRDITEHDILSISLSTPDGIDVPAYRVVVRGDRNWSKGGTLAGGAVASARQEFASSSTAENAATLVKHPTARELVFELGGGAVGTAAAHLALHGAERLWASVAVPLSTSWATIDMGDVVTLSHPRFGLSAGRKMLVCAIRFDFAAQRIVLGLWG